MYSACCHPVTILTPNRPGAMESIVVAIRATIAGGNVRTAVDAKSFIFVVTAANADIRVKDSRLWSQNSVLPPKPRSLIIERAKSRL